MSRAEPRAGDREKPAAEHEAAAGVGPGRQAGPDAGTAADAGPASAAGPAAVRPPRLRWTLGLFRSELVTVFRRRRTMALFAVLAGVPLLVGIAVRIETRDGGSMGGGRGDAGPAFIEQVSNNGLFLTFAG